MGVHIEAISWESEESLLAPLGCVSVYTYLDKHREGVWEA